MDQLIQDILPIINQDFCIAKVRLSSQKLTIDIIARNKSFRTELKSSFLFTVKEICRFPSWMYRISATYENWYEMRNFLQFLDSKEKLDLDLLESAMKVMFPKFAFVEQNTNSFINKFCSEDLMKKVLLLRL